MKIKYEVFNLNTNMREKYPRKFLRTTDEFVGVPYEERDTYEFRQHVGVVDVNGKHICDRDTLYKENGEERIATMRGHHICGAHFSSFVSWEDKQGKTGMSLTNPKLTWEDVIEGTPFYFKGYAKNSAFLKYRVEGGFVFAGSLTVYTSDKELEVVRVCWSRWRR